MRRLAWVAFAAAVGCGAAHPTEVALHEVVPGGTIAITRVNVIAMTDEVARSGQTVVIRDGRIVALGASGGVEIPAGAVVIDGHDRFLMPGLADMHVHMNSTDLHTYPRYGITTVRNMWGTPYVSRMARDGRRGLVA